MLFRLNQYPTLKKHFNLRVSKRLFIIKNLRTGDCLQPTKEELLLLSLCDGTQTVSDLIEIYSRVYDLSEEETMEMVKVINNRYGDALFFLEQPCPQEHVGSLKKQLKYRGGDWAYSPFREESPFELQISLTEGCNHRCVYCFKSCEGITPEELDAETWEKVINEASELGVQEITFSGGEPTLYPDFIRLVEYAVKKGLYPKISTNGTMMDEDFVKKLYDTGAEYIHLSLPAASHDLYNQITKGKGNLHKVEAGIQILKHYNFYIRVKMVLIPQNIGEVETLLDYCEEQGVDFVHLAPFILTGCSRGDFRLLPPEDELKKVCDLVEKRTENSCHKMRIAKPPLKSLQWSGPDEIVKCGGVKECLTILTDGSYSFCEALGHDKEFLLGNIKQDSLLDVWFSDKPDEITGVKEECLNDICKACEYLDNCKTGCFLFSQIMNDNPWDMDPRCWKYKGDNNLFRLVSQNQRLDYPVLKNTVRIKKLPEYCWITDTENDVNEFITPSKAFLMALCTGEVNLTTIRYIFKKVFDLKESIVDEFVKNTFLELEDCLMWQESSNLCQQRFNISDFIYNVAPGRLEKEERCDTPCEMHLSLTHACNFRCIYCFNGADIAREDELSTDQWLDIIRQGHELGVVKCTITGGEPMLHSGFFDILAELKKYDILPYICTNGSLINEQAIKRLQALGIENIQLSLDTTNFETHNYLSGIPGSLTQVLKAIKALVKAGIKVFIKSVLTPINMKQVPELIDTCLKLKVSKLILDRFDVSASGRGGTELLLSVEDMAWLKQVVQEKKNSVEGKMMVKAVAHPTTWHDEEDIVPCGAFRRSFIVLPSGDISACEKLIDVPEMTAGNIKLETLNEIWFGQRISGLINPPFEKIDPTCQVCKNFEECRTGCYAIKYFQKINMYQKDPRCFLTNIV